MVKAVAGTGAVAVFLVTIALPSVSDAQTSSVPGQWQDGRGTARVITVMDFPEGLLPLDMAHMDLMVMDDPEDGTLLSVIGYGPGSACLGTVPFDAFLNPAKTIAYYDHGEGLVIVSSEYPSSAARNNASYAWDSLTCSLVPVDSWVSDASARLLESADSLLAIGEIRQAADSISMMFYGWAYYDEAELACRILRAAHLAAMEADDRGDEEYALECYDQLLYALDRTTGDEDWFITIGSRERYLSGEYARFLPPEELSEILKDLADVLKDNGVAAEAVLRNTSRLLVEGEDDR
ncbi:MAG: hypothetical protein JXA64_04975 [Candidatus Fermentibacteraceae bacterium]|nr:hypothetical protein [Candidatus Fermentibacteraceae bacterium]